MRQTILRGMSFMAVVVLLGAYLAHGQNQGGVSADFSPLVIPPKPPQKFNARSAPAKVTSDEDYALTSKGYVLIGWVKASQAGRKTDAEVTKQLESAILQKAAEAGGDVVRLLTEGALATVSVPTGKTKTERTCERSQTVTVSAGQDCVQSCFTDSAGNRRCFNSACSPKTNTVEKCVEWGEPRIVPITRKEEGLFSSGAVWRYDLEQASVLMRARGEINNAAGSGDLNRVQAMLKEHPDLISSKDASGETPLHAAIAAKAGKNLVEFLLASNADVNARDANGATPLHLAANWGDQPLVQQLLDHKADINARTNTGETILLLTACKGNTQMAEFLLANKADVTIRDTGGNTPLHCAAIGGHPETVRVLLAHKADVNAGNLHGYTPLAFVKFVTRLRTTQSKEVAEILRQAGGGMVPDTKANEVAEASAMPSPSGVGQVQSEGEVETKEAAELPSESAGGTSQSSGQTGAAVGCDVDMKALKSLLSHGQQVLFADAETGQTPLHEEAAAGCKEVVELLLAKNAEPNAKDHDGFTPLHMAASADVAGLLLAKGAEVNAKGKDGFTPLHTAARKGYKDVAELLLANGADVNAQSNWGWTPLHAAADKGHKDMAEFLLAKGADVNAKADHNGFTPLHSAASQGHTDVVELLLANKADANARDNLGFTPVSYVEGHVDVAELLLAKGGEVNIKSTKGRTALHAAAEDGHKDVAELLLAKGADVNAKDHDGFTPLHAAASQGHADVAELLLAKGAEVNAKNITGRTALHSAAEDGHKDVAELLLAKGADVNTKDIHGHTPLFFANHKGHMDVAQLLRQHGGHE
jgi:ankyrin repeat protein